MIPFKIMVYDRTLKPLFPLPLDTPPEKPGVEEVRVTPRIAEVGTAVIRVHADHPRARALHEPGLRVRIWDRFGGHLLSGPIVSVDGAKGASARGTSTITLIAQDDLRLLWRILGWVQPTKGIDQQASDNSDARYVLSGMPAETVLKRVFTDNAIRRLGLPVTVATDQGRGRTISYAVRMQPLADGLFPAVIDAGVIPFIRQEDDGSPLRQRLALDVRPAVTRPQILSGGPETPQLTDWAYSMQGPEAVRGVAGGQGQGNARIFRSAVSQAELDSWGALYAGEIFDDSRQESTPSGVQVAINQALQEKASKVDLSLSLCETERWAYGKAWRVGDLIRTRIVPGAGVLTTQIPTAELTWTPSGGYKATTQVGGADRSSTRAAVKALAARVHSLETGW